MIYLFCNERYGKPFLDSARDYGQKHGTKFTVVVSVQQRPIHFRLRSLIELIRRIKQRRLQRQELRAGTSLEVCWVSDVNALSFSGSINPSDHGIIAGFNQIFRRQTIQRFASLVNFHPSILPLYRGPVPSFWCLKNGETQSGFTLHRVTERIDAGEILYQEEVSLEGIVEPKEADQKIASCATRILWRYLDHLRTGQPWTINQIDAHRVYRQSISYASFPK